MAAAAPAAKGAALAGAPAGPGAFVLFSSLSFLSSFEKVSSRSRFHSLSLSLSLSHTHTHTHTQTGASARARARRRRLRVRDIRFLLLLPGLLLPPLLGTTKRGS